MKPPIQNISGNEAAYEPLKTVSVPCPVCGASEYENFASGTDFEYDTCRERFNFVRCLKCGVLFLNPRPDTSDLSRIYPECYNPYHFDKKGLTLKVRDMLERKKAAKLLRIIPEKGSVLDAGCGGPGFLENLRKFGSPGWELWGNDINENVVENLSRRGFGAIGDRFEDISMPDGSFDAIFFKQVLEHLDSPRKILANASRLLRPGGRLIIETPNFQAWDPGIFRKSYWGGYHFPRHWTLFSPSTLEAAGAEAGLRTESVYFMFSPSFWVQSAHHFLKDRGWPAVMYRFFTHTNPLVMAAAVMLDIAQKTLTGRTSNMGVILVK